MYQKAGNQFNTLNKKFKKKLKNSTFLVTGGAGFIGSSMSKKLLTLGCKVICFDDLSTGSLENIEEVSKNSKFFFIKGDVNNFLEINKVFEKYKIDYVLHYAAVVGVDRTLEYPLSVLNDLEGMRNILDLSYMNNVKKVIFSSSSEIYGKPVEFPQREDSTPLNTRLPYALVKGAGEAYFENYYKMYGLQTVSLRFFNVYGPRQDTTPYGFVTAIFTRQAINGEELTVFGDGKQTRDFVFIEDNLNATLLALLISKCNGQSLNIGTGKQTTVLSLAKKIIKKSGKKLKIKHCSPRKMGDMRGRCPDIFKMKTILKYEPIFSLEEGLEITYNWYKNRKSNDNIHQKSRFKR